MIAKSFSSRPSSEPAPINYPRVWFPPLDWDAGIIKVGVDGVYEEEDEETST